jgi:hypothetical protein
MKHQIDISSTAAADNIIGWCLENLPDKEWTIELLRFSPSVYRFEFVSAEYRLLAMLAS